MGLNTRSKAFKVIFAAIAAVLIYTMAVAPGNRPSQVPHVPPPVEEPAVGETPAPEVDGDAPADETELEHAARRIVHVPDTRITTNNRKWSDKSLDEVTGESIADEFANAFKAALEGDLDAGYHMLMLRDSCDQIPSSEEKLESAITGAMDRVQSLSLQGTPVAPEGTVVGKLNFGRTFGLTLYPDEQRNRTHLTDWYNGCEKVRSTFNPDLRNQLEEMAQGGHVMARYIYATWPPPMQIGDGTFEQSQTWQTKALEFSYANVLEGEAAGLLAFGQSYFLTFFTPLNFALGGALIAAAVECGANTAVYDDYVLRMIRMNEKRDRDWWGGATNDEVLEYAQQLAEYCR